MISSAFVAITHNALQSLGYLTKRTIDTMQPFVLFKQPLLLVTFLRSSSCFCICLNPDLVLHLMRAALLPQLRRELLLATWIVWLQ